MCKTQKSLITYFLMGYGAYNAKHTKEKPYTGKSHE